MLKPLDLLFIAVMLIIAACEATPTPLPVVIDSTEPAALSTAPVGTLRYAVAPNAAGLLIDIINIDPYAEVIYLDAPPTSAQVGTEFEFAVAFGDYPEAERSSRSYEVSLIMRNDVPPLDNPEVRAIIQRAAVPEELLAGLDIPGVTILKDEPVGNLRADLASAGYPDGFDLKITSIYAPGIEAFAARLREAGINAEIVPIDSPDAVVALGAYGSLPDRIPLFRAAISYWMTPGIRLELSNNGVPLPPRLLQ